MNGSVSVFTVLIKAIKEFILVANDNRFMKCAARTYK